MSERFYFDIESGRGTIRDDVGVESADLEQALSDARSVISEMAGELANDVLGDAPVLVVRDEAGSSIVRLPIGEVQHRLSSSDYTGARRLMGRRH
ncbi:DUF6894 family protein [Methylobacterium sp. P31]